MDPEIAPSESLGEATGVRERNWIPLAIAAALIVGALTAALVFSASTRPASESTASPATADPYGAYLPITNLAMSESANLAGGKVTYLDGSIANQGNRTVTNVVVQVTFRNYAREVAQSQRMPLTVIRMRDPYIDTEKMSAAPLKPGGQEDFRLIFDAVSPDWAGAIPELRIVRVNAK